MPDWRELVRQRLSGLDLDSAEKEEVHAELAAHLEESFAAWCLQGVPETEATRRTLGLVSDWQDLRLKISAAKKGEHRMKERLHRLWIPGFLTFLLFTLSLMTFQRSGFAPHIVSWSGPGTVFFYVPWLASLPFVGALGAYLSSQAGGSRGTVLLSSVFPVLALTAAFLLMFPIDMIVELLVGNHVDFRIVAAALLREGISWLLVPGAALLAGGFLVHILFRPRSSSQVTKVADA